MAVDRPIAADLVTNGTYVASLLPAVIPNDPIFHQQWHLLDFTADFDINIVDVWDDYTGLGVTFGVIDSGIQYTHPDLVGQIDTVLDHDAVDGDSDASVVNADENHGTTVAGTIVAAANNGIGVAGVAYGGRVAGFRQGFGENVEAQLAENLGLQWTVDISNNSWGYNGFFFDDLDSPLFQPSGDAIEQAVQDGRGGLGTVIVFAAGNERLDGQDVNYHGFQNSRHTIAVAATDQNGENSYFSTPGAALLVAAPGSGIATTDRTGADGYVGGDYVFMSGTSFASPIVAGVAGLMIEANPDLGHRDVQEILAYSARQVDVADPGWAINGAADWNGGGLHVSHAGPASAGTRSRRSRPPTRRSPCPGPHAGLGR